MSEHRRAGAFVYGVHPVRVLLEREPQMIEEILMVPPRGDRRRLALAALAQAQRVRVTDSDRPALEAILASAGVGAANHQGVVLRRRAAPAAADFEGLLARLAREAGPAARPALVLVLDEVQDPHNLGACLRTAAAAGVDAVLTPRRRAAGLTPAVQKVASGAADLVPLVSVANLARSLDALRDRGLLVVGTDAQAPRSLYETDLTSPLAIVLGGEGGGLRRLTREHCDALVCIPTPGELSSLNVSVAAGVALFECNRQRRAPGSPARLGAPGSH